MRFSVFELDQLKIPLWKAYYNALKMWVWHVGAGECAGGAGEMRAAAGAGRGEITPAPTCHIHIF